MSWKGWDKKYVWHPFTAIGQDSPNIPVTKAKGVYLYDNIGNKFIDAISSWWVNLHGHSHPYIAEKISEQARELEHVMFAGFTHRPAVELAERLLSHLPENQAKIFYSDNGSTAVEVALKMAFQYWYNQDQQKTKVIAMEGAYHGDTFGAMSVGARNEFTQPFLPFLFDVEFVDCPVQGKQEIVLEQISTILESGEVAAFIFEPLVQGTAGMRIYSPEVLDKMVAMCRNHDVLIIADEVMTGFGRTGTFFASDRLNHKPDIFCLSKGITGGTMALGATSCTEGIYNAFWGSSEEENNHLKTFMHGHSYTANPIACAAALASLDLLEREDTIQDIRRIVQKHEKAVELVRQNSYVEEVRHLGTILAVEFKSEEQTGYFNRLRNQLYEYFMDRGILLRPLGNVVYLIPPYCITDEELDFIYTAIREFKPEQ